MSELFGRAAEVASIGQFLAAVPTGSSTFLIEGEAGIGKTSLWQAAVDLAGGLGYKVLVSRCVAAEAKLSFTALSDLMENVPPDVLVDLPEPQRRPLETALLRADPGRDAVDWRAIGLATLNTFRALARRGPVIVAVDDMQWLDDSSARILSFARRRLATEPVGFVETERKGLFAEDAGSPGRAAALGSASGAGGLAAGVPNADVVTLAVGPLGPEDLARAIEARLRTLPSRGKLAEAIKISGGNPFFALELAAAAAEAGAGAGLPWGPGGSALTPAIEALIRRKLERLQAAAMDLITMTAAAAQPTLRLAERFFGDANRSAEAVDTAIAAGLLGIEAGKLRLVHPLLGTVAYAQLPASGQQAIHRRLAELAEEEEEERAGHLALAATGPDSEVAEILEKAATQARERGALEAAAALSERAAALTPEAESDARGRRLVQAGEFRWQVGDMAGARSILEEAAQVTPAGRLRARTLICLGRLLFHSQTTDAVAAARQALEECGDVLPLRVQALVDLAFMMNDVAPASATAEEGVRLALQLGQDDLTAQALAALALCQAVDGDPAADRTLERGLEVAAGVSYVPPARSPTFIAGLRAAWRGDVDSARSWMTKAYQRAMDWGEESSLTDILVQISAVERAAGELAAANEHARAARQFGTPETHGRVHASAAAAMAMVAAIRGDAEACQAAVEDGMMLSSRAESMAGVVGCTSAKGLLALGLGRYEEADESLAGLCDAFVIRSYEPGILWFVIDEVEALIALDKLAAAAAILDPFERRARELQHGPALAAALRCGGMLAAARGDLSRAIAASDEAARLVRRFPLPFEFARTSLAQGTVFRRARRWREARLALERAVEAFQALGAAAWAARGQQQLERLAGRTPGRWALTESELQVVRLAAAGRTNREIAAELFVSVRAVEKSLTGAYRKLGVRSRTELAARQLHELGG